MYKSTQKAVSASLWATQVAVSAIGHVEAPDPCARDLLGWAASDFRSVFEREYPLQLLRIKTYIRSLARVVRAQVVGLLVTA